MRLRHLVYILPAALVLLFAACGGDDSGGSSGGTGSDETYVAQICAASLKFNNALEAATKNMKPEDLSSADAVAKILAGPFDDYLKALAKATPPKDVKPYHDGVIKAFKDAQEKLKKDPNALSGLNPPDPPQATKDRLDKVAAKNKDCVAAGFTFGD